MPFLSYSALLHGPARGTNWQNEGVNALSAKWNVLVTSWWAERSRDALTNSHLPLITLQRMPLSPLLQTCIQAFQFKKYNTAVYTERYTAVLFVVITTVGLVCLVSIFIKYNCSSISLSTLIGNNLAVIILAYLNILS